MVRSPMFPLGSALLPGAVLPLHVFEPRYTAMVRDLLRDDDRPPEFGVVMIERGFEVGGGDQRTAVGTMARIVDLRAEPGERYLLAAVGQRRIVVHEWLPDDPYPLADVDDWPDEAGGNVDRGTLEDLLQRVGDVAELARRAGAASVDPRPLDIDLDGDPGYVLYQFGVIAPVGPADRHALLRAASAADRARVLSEALDDAFAAWQFRSAPG